MYPLSIDEFRKKYYRQKALVIKLGSSSRFDDLVKEHLYNCSLEQLCENTASEQIHIWFPDPNGDKNSKAQKEIDSFGTNDIPMALKAHERGGASLYFGSPVEFRERY